jgi:predicted RNA-binding protein with PUA-like domain
MGAGKRYWLMKSEPSEVSVDDLKKMPNSTVGWFGVRNYQARNFMMRDMKKGDGVLFYHSSCAQPGIVGIAEVAGPAYPDPTQFDPNSKYFDPKASAEKPRWYQVDVKLKKKIPLIALDQLRSTPTLQGMKLLARGNRLSITPVTEQEWDVIQGLANN